jgi:predicted DNA-binding protein YlxM (UPF0122 family)
MSKVKEYYYDDIMLEEIMDDFCVICGQRIYDGGYVCKACQDGFNTKGGEDVENR